ncbi:hypothetical protein M501DRAFT_1000882 [Patellaria atrata CBS 101060]|uniref:Uncharacterized protein n=1 Tax=Patellaria atrata CBS 101060 TaxID=1346257 RepID=A0A9P4VQ72_9PEZI|nr:hypothetical protein M501DRAFT_1000882 [Patellaria atrata CBS 101060]
MSDFEFADCEVFVARLARSSSYWRVSDGGGGGYKRTMTDLRGQHDRAEPTGVEDRSPSI